MKSTVEKIEAFAEAIKEWRKKCKRNLKVSPIPTPQQFELDPENVWVKKTIKELGL
jgi:hypothetical protein